MDVDYILRQPYDLLELSFEGVSAYVRRREEIASAFASTTSSKDANCIKSDAKRLILRVLLIHEITVFEEMIKAHAAHYLKSELGDVSTASPMPDEELRSDFQISSRPCQTKWSKVIRGLTKDTARDQEIPEDQTKINNFIQYVLKFREWPHIFVGRIIRNLEIHNRGVMNERNFKLYPGLCDIGQRPEWDIGLCYTLMDCINRLNDFLAYPEHPSV